MSSAYNPENLAHRQLLATMLEVMLIGANFVKRENATKDTEDIYEFPIPQVPGARVVVFTTIRHRAVRGDGEDAIRVGVIYGRKDGADKFILSEKRVNRTGTVEAITQRTLDRMRDAFKLFRDSCRTQGMCQDCGAPKFKSKAGNWVCANTCWVKQ